MIAVPVLIAALSSAARVIGSTTDLVVTTTSDATNGDTSSVAALSANPGPDGVSLREAIVATNNDLGIHTIPSGLQTASSGGNSRTFDPSDNFLVKHSASGAVPVPHRDRTAGRSPVEVHLAPTAPVTCGIPEVHRGERGYPA